MATLPNAAAPTGSETAGARISKLQASYRSRGRAVWLGGSAAAVMAVALAIWMIPWVPVGMTQDDYSFAVWVGLVLAMGTAVMSLLAYFARGPATGEGETAEVWRGLMGGAAPLASGGNADTAPEFGPRPLKHVHKPASDGRR
jgi:hypothetical protein